MKTAIGFTIFGPLLITLWAALMRVESDSISGSDANKLSYSNPRQILALQETDVKDKALVKKLIDEIITVCINHDEDDAKFYEFVESEIERLQGEAFP